ncbi:hypothetical protein [Bosea beijingensis]
MQSRSRRGAHRSPFTCLINAPFELHHLDFEFDHESLGFEIETENGRSRPILFVREDRLSGMIEDASLILFQ